VLVAMLRAWPNHAAYEAVIAQALRRRGAEVALLTCGGGQPACEMGWARRALPRPCDRCAFYTDEVAAALGVRQYRIRDLVPWGSAASAAPADARALDASHDPEAASRISVPWFLRSDDAAGVPEGSAAAADFAVSAAAVEGAATRVLGEFRPDAVFMVNGLFAAEATVRALALERGIRAPTYEIAPRAGALVFSQGTPAPAYDTDAVWAAVHDRPMTPGQRRAIEGLLAGRAAGVGAHETYFDGSAGDAAALRERLGIPAGSRVASLFTNLSWDSATLFHDVAFPSMMDWIEGAVRAVDGRDDVTLVVRVHPSEARWGTRQEVLETVRSRLGRLPENVRFVLPGDPLSSYALLDVTDLVLAYTTTVGLEAANRGIPVALAGDVHYRGRGFTIDLESPADLEAAVAAPARRLRGEEVELARRYAFTFFFRCMIPFPAVRVDGHLVTELPADVEALAPGRDPHLDWVCDRILDGGEFTLPAELALPDEQTSAAA
jgi:hypothetical protein